MKPATVFLVAVFAVFVSAAYVPAAAESITVTAAGGENVGIKVTNVSTGESKTAQSGSNGNATIRGLEPGVYKVEEPGAQIRYVEIKPGANSQVTMTRQGAGNVQQLVATLEPATRQSVTRRLDAPGTAGDKARAIDEQIKDTEEKLKAAIEAEKRLPGLINIGQIVADLNTLEAIRSHYADQARREGERGLRQNAPMSNWRFDVFGGAESMELGGRTGLGTVFSGGAERGLMKSEDRVTGASFEGRLSYRISQDLWGLSNLRVVAAAGYFNAQDSRAAEEPVGGRNVASTYHTPAPNNSTGLTLGATGESVRQDLELTGYRAVLGLSSRIALTDSRRTGFSPFLGVKYNRFEQEYDGVLRSLTFNGITSETNQRVVDQYIGPSFGGYFDWKCEETSFMIGGKIDVMHRWSRVDSVQRNRCDLCPPAERAFDATFTDDDSGFTLGGEFRVGVSHRFVSGLSLGATAGLRYLGDRTTIVNPETPPQGNIRADTESAVDRFISLRARIAF